MHESLRSSWPRDAFSKIAHRRIERLPSNQNAIIARIVGRNFPLLRDTQYTRGILRDSCVRHFFFSIETNVFFDVLSFHQLYRDVINYR